MSPASVDHDQKAEELRKATTFHPTLWGDFFLTYKPPTAPQQEYMKERAEVLREDVRKIVNGSTEIRETMDLIITLQRLGLDYYYETEIDKLLHDIYNLDYNDKDLNLVSLRFYLLKKNNYDVSSDVFLNFKIQDGSFANADTRSLLSLYNAAYLRRHGEKMKRLVQQYSKEVEWRDEDYVPETMWEHLQVSMESIGSVALACAAYVGMGDVITKETLQWVLSYPQFLTSFGVFVRLSNYLVSTKREQTADHSASTVHCYMKEHGTTMKDACEKIKELTEDSWKDMLEQCLELKGLPKVVPRTVFEFSRTTDNMYKNCDAFTCSEALKEMITLLFVEPIPE
ncbi:hypothetical protein HU200_028795 [Digitaria exilis]|uniref:Terpene synthase N-terminal domain-containing protein n=1 Tax=Digitaria exilis TaxID=1010633 RepID=A0A835BW14_9POAL|nr:hypothetical protein HU200_028795 [Digitaria exilis]